MTISDSEINHAKQNAANRQESDGDRMLRYRDNHLSDDALIADECRRYGIVLPSGEPLGAWALLRHIYNNRDAALGAMRLACDGWEHRAKDAEARVEALEGQLRSLRESYGRAVKS